MSSGIKVKYTPASDWQMAVAVAVSEQPKANALAKTTARKVAAQAKRNLRAGASSGKSKGKLHKSTSTKPGGNVNPDASLEIYREQVAKETFYKDTEVYKRRKIVPGSPIPVSLVVSDHWASQAFEYGQGAATVMSRYMSAAARSAVGGAVILIRGGGR